jgi:hypothetical protein
VEDVTHTLHYLLKLLDNMKRLDEDAGAGGDGPQRGTRAE